MINGQATQLCFNDRLNEGEGNYAIVDLDKSHQENSIVGDSNCSFQPKISEQPSKAAKKVKSSK